MDGNRQVLSCAVWIALSSSWAIGATGNGAVELARVENEYSHVRLEAARVEDRPALAVVFTGTNDLHYYARSETAPAPQFNLRIHPFAEGVEFDEALFPPWQMFHDVGLEKDVEVYVGDFRVLVPLHSTPSEPVRVDVRITGMACTSQLCLPPFDKTVTATIDFAGGSATGSAAASAVMPTGLPAPSAPEQAKPDETTPSRQAILPYSTGVYYLLAIAAGISINIMPCVLPVIPLILMRLIDQSKRAGGRRLAGGLAFCVGVVLFFAAFALVSAVINLTTGSVLDLNSLFRYPKAVIVLFLAIVFFGLAMLDVITLSVPSAVAGRQTAGSGLLGTAGMGFFAGVLSTPCSGALLGFVLVWAQTQPLPVSTAAIVLMGVGMALPYAVIVSVPSLMDRLPKPGTWMEIFKKSTGFLLFFIAVKLTLAALPKDRLLNVLLYGIVFSFCVWMWGKWVGFATPAGKRRLVRFIALVLAVGGALWLLPASGAPEAEAIGWQSYDRAAVESAASRGRPVLLKFTADWCTNCKVVERKVYRDPEVIRWIADRDVLPILADTTVIDYPATEDLRQIYGEAGNVPVTIVRLPGGQMRKLRGIFDKQDLIDLLKTLPEGRK
ncbi:MAG TPA: cytochrome c biogenesis protein CcdA [Sedimentisphaerales bacterium]|nr:cytochrome c biogenesis protein CcdA [Sedimentisphaerales bacterium]HRS09872.1 cytochrome c biogenesis protein CcdA [Sedimentisphaerales bacterium]HRV46478.1 cytochrome c biogenesis protein CcdA [Sedimentisphaerales bacterium]